MNDHRRARRWRAFSFLGTPVAVLLLALGGAVAAEARVANCVPDGIDEQAVVERVHDGDTLRLRDGRTVRLIGINTPELARSKGNVPAEPHAEQARAALAALLPPGSPLALDFDADREDRYGRLLAHLYLVPIERGSVQQRLLEQGHGVAIVVPPNAGNAECYRAAEQRAREGGAGLWAHARYTPVDAKRLEPRATGFRMIRGRVNRVVETRGSWWLDLDGDTSLRILKPDMIYFRDYPLGQLAGRTIVARGWLVPRQGKRPDSIMGLRHPAAMELIDAPASR
jgi:endonuclease YncB( thermonuclease family)